MIGVGPKCQETRLDSCSASASSQTNEACCCRARKLARIWKPARPKISPGLATAVLTHPYTIVASHKSLLTIILLSTQDGIQIIRTNSSPSFETKGRCSSCTKA